MARKKDRHKPRIFLLVGAIILLLSLGFLYFLSVKSIDAAWFNDLWSYRKRIDITNGSGSNLSNFQVSFTLDTASLITAGKMKADCSDIRIIDQTGSAVNYWIEENNPGCNNSATKIWAKVASLPITGAPIYVYYGNSSAKPTQDGNKVFDFFDDFVDFDDFLEDFEDFLLECFFEAADLAFLNADLAFFEAEIDFLYIIYVISMIVIYKK